jgi:acyl carrier protein
MMHPPSAGPFGAEAAQRIADWLSARVAQWLGVPADEIDPRTPFSRYGLSSADAVTLVGELEEWLGRELPVTLLWDYPSVARLSAHLADGPCEA